MVHWRNTQETIPSGSSTAEKLAKEDSIANYLLDRH